MRNQSRTKHRIARDRAARLRQVQRSGGHASGRRARGRGVASAEAGRVAPRGVVVTASVPCSRFPNELPNVSNPAEVPQFVGVQDGADRLHSTVRNVEREDVD